MTAPAWLKPGVRVTWANRGSHWRVLHVTDVVELTDGRAYAGAAPLPRYRYEGLRSLLTSDLVQVDETGRVIDEPAPRTGTLTFGENPTPGPKGLEAWLPAGQGALAGIEREISAQHAAYAAAREGQAKYATSRGELAAMKRLWGEQVAVGDAVVAAPKPLPTVERLARHLFEADVQARSFAVAKAECYAPGTKIVDGVERYRNVLAVAWERDERGWRTAALAKAHEHLDAHALVEKLRGES